MAYNTPEYSESEIERRREQAKKNHELVDPVTGKRKFGGPQPGAGRPRKRRATEVINEKTEGIADKMFDKLEGMIDSDSQSMQLRAIQLLIDVANKENEYQAREAKALENMSTEDLVKLIEDGVTHLSQQGDLNFDFIGSAEEITDQPGLEEGAE